MFREIRTSEKITDRERKEEGYLKIKPENPLNTKELNDLFTAEIQRLMYEG